MGGSHSEHWQSPWPPSSAKATLPCWAGHVDFLGFNDLQSKKRHLGTLLPRGPAVLLQILSPNLRPPRAAATCRPGRGQGATSVVTGVP